MNYRTAEQKDLETINDILTVSFEHIYAYFAKKSFSSLENAIVAEEGNRLVGAINYRIFDMENSKIGYLYYLAVIPDFRRKGIGKSLILQAINLIEKETEPEAIYAAVEKKNIPSRELFKRTGFIHIRRSAFKEKYRDQKSRLYSLMNFMPWEELFQLSADHNKIHV